MVLQTPGQHSDSTVDKDIDNDGEDDVFLSYDGQGHVTECIKPILKVIMDHSVCWTKNHMEARFMTVLKPW